MNLLMWTNLHMIFAYKVIIFELLEQRVPRVGITNSAEDELILIKYVKRAKNTNNNDSIVFLEINK